MKTFYYIAYRKPRNRSKVYAGDGLWDARTMTEARKEIASARNVPARLISLREHIIQRPIATYPLSNY